MTDAETTPRFSIVTPSLNQSAWLPQHLDSVRIASSESGRTVEHLIIDGGSTDGTLEILAGQEFSEWTSEPDRGQSDAINKGLARARGEIVSYLCADDLLEPTALRLVDRAFVDHPEADVVYGDGFFLEGESGWKRLKCAGAYYVDRLRRGNFLIQPAVFWRRGVTEKFGGFDIRWQYCMDHAAWLRWAGSTRWIYVPEPLAVCRLHGAAKTSRALADAWREAAVMQAEFGIRGKPQRDALWMALIGQHYYRWKRRVFEEIGRRRKRE